MLGLTFDTLQCNFSALTYLTFFDVALKRGAKHIKRMVISGYIFVRLSRYLGLSL